MSRGTIVIMHSDTSVFGDLSNALRASGYSVFRVDARDEDIGSALLAICPRAVIIERAAFKSKDISAAISVLINSANVERIVMIGEPRPEEARKLSRCRGFTALRPPFDIVRLFAALENASEKKTEREQLRTDIYYRIDSLMITLGITSSMLGHAPLREAVFCILTSAEKRPALSSVVYPHTAAELSLSVHAVERAVRLTVAEIWNDLPPNIRKILVPEPQSSGLTRPTNKIFLYAVSDYLSKALADELERYSQL